ncbi:hypothetical protein TNCV_4170891 [Trichonephila clavipes]|nr:hypothetical protein TNCV_4170891 [Trichonephila clavipes]
MELEHFDNLLNSDNGNYEALSASTETRSQGVVEIPLLEEAIEATNKLKDNKAPCLDAIPSELLKNGGKETSKKVYDLIQAMWEQEIIVIPKEWEMSTTCVIYKKELYSSAQIIEESKSTLVQVIRYYYSQMFYSTGLSTSGKHSWRLPKWIWERKIHCRENIQHPSDFGENK